MDYICFASGSSGNCALLRGGGVNLLIDAGISMKRIRLSLRSLGLDLGDLRGVLVTHEHSDHVSALGMLSKYTDLPFSSAEAPPKPCCGRESAPGRTCAPWGRT